MYSKKEEGFTLIELLVVIAIIGILAGMVLVSMGGARSKARDARRVSDMRQYVSAQEMNYGDGNTDTYVTQAAGPALAVGTYLAAAPQDPTNNGTCGSLTAGNYKYCALANAAFSPIGFCYYARLENAKNINGTNYYFYTASENGNFYRVAEPTTQATCNSQG